MKSSLLALALLTASAAQASAQETTQGQMCATAAVTPPPAGTAPNRMLSDDAEVAGRIAVAKKAIAPGQAMGRGQVVLNAGLLHHAAVEYRRSPTPPMVHTRMAEFFYVVDGEADLILGGTLTNPRCRNSSNLEGDGVEGGVTHRVKKGTYILVPENTVHLHKYRQEAGHDRAGPACADAPSRPVLRKCDEASGLFEGEQR
jgi:oxalate decarboxylase/phosphoglucose isomerase-like protein (cupin superfamily)